MRSRNYLVPAAALAVLFATCRPADAPAPATGLSPADSLAQAVDAVNARIVNDPANGALYLERGQLYLRLDSVKRAVQDHERAVQLDSTNVYFHLALGDLYYSKARVEEAMVQYRKASALDPGDRQARLKLAEMDLVLRRYQDAMDQVNGVLEEDPNIAHGYYLKGWIHMETHDTAKALSSFRTAVEQDPQDYDAYIMLGKLSAAQHDPLAAQYYATATALRPNSMEAWYNKGVYHQDHGEDSLALDCYAHILTADPNNAVAYYNQGWVKLEHLNDLSGAKRDFSKAIDIEPNYFDAWYNRGVAMERSGQLDSAAANYQITVSIVPEHKMALEALDRLQAQGVRIKTREQKAQKGK